MPPAKTYDLYLSRTTKVLVIAPLGIFGIVGLLLAVSTFSDGKDPWSGRVGGLLFLAVVVWNAYWVLSLPQRISVSETGQIEFSSPLRRRTVTSGEVVSIRPDGGQFGFLTVRTARGKIRLLNQFDGFHDFLTDLKARNPAVEIRGC
jgi:hypothetical protein